MLSLFLAGLFILHGIQNIIGFILQTFFGIPIYTGTSFGPTHYEWIYPPEVVGGIVSIATAILLMKNTSSARKAITARCLGGIINLGTLFSIVGSSSAPSELAIFGVLRLWPYILFTSTLIYIYFSNNQVVISAGQDKLIRYWWILAIFGYLSQFVYLLYLMSSPNFYI